MRIQTRGLTPWIYALSLLLSFRTHASPHEVRPRFEGNIKVAHMEIHTVGSKVGDLKALTFAARAGHTAEMRLALLNKRASLWESTGLKILEVEHAGNLTKYRILVTDTGIGPHGTDLHKLIAGGKAKDGSSFLPLGPEELKRLEIASNFAISRINAQIELSITNRDAKFNPETTPKSDVAYVEQQALAALNDQKIRSAYGAPEISNSENGRLNGENHQKLSTIVNDPSQLSQLREALLKIDSHDERLTLLSDLESARAGVLDAAKSYDSAKKLQAQKRYEEVWKKIMERASAAKKIEAADIQATFVVQQLGSSPKTRIAPRQTAGAFR